MFINFVEMKVSHSTLELLFKKGHKTPSELSKLTGIPLRTVERTVAKLKKGLSLERKKGSGRIQKLNIQDKRRLAQLVNKDDIKTSSELAEEMTKRGSPRVHPNTILNYLHRAGFYKFLPKKSLKLTEKHKMNRVKWCQQNKKRRWHNWIFSDESRFELYDIKGKRWAKSRPEVGVPKFGPSLIIWTI